MDCRIKSAKDAASPLKPFGILLLKGRAVIIKPTLENQR
jgi:hypothetical protein